MCRIFASQDPASYAPVARALRLSRHMTSIRIEAAYWSILDEMAAREGMTTSRFIGKLHDEVLDWHGEVKNFASMLRVTCTLYMRTRGDPERRPEVAPEENRAVVT
jgi:predicted DNA-binding ribbon-helix-helix protein